MSMSFGFFLLLLRLSISSTDLIHSIRLTSFFHRHSLLCDIFYFLNFVANFFSLSSDWKCQSVVWLCIDVCVCALSHRFQIFNRKISTSKCNRSIYETFWILALTELTSSTLCHCQNRNNARRSTTVFYCNRFVYRAYSTLTHTPIFQLRFDKALNRTDDETSLFISESQLNLNDANNRLKWFMKNEP